MASGGALDADWALDGCCVLGGHEDWQGTVRASRIANADRSNARWMVICPACGFAHVFDSRWVFNGDPEKPTFSPSYLQYESQSDPGEMPRCHSFVRDGKIQFLSDCTHSMAGQTVDLPELPE